MPVASSDRPLDDLREETIDRLIVNYGHGRLSQEALERRLDQALDTQDHGLLLRLIEDLDPTIDPAYLEQKHQQFAADPANHQDPEPHHLISIFGGNERSGAWVVPARLRIITIFGGTELDMSGAHFAARETRIRLLCLFGGVEIRVPAEVAVVSRAACVFGGISNKARGPAAADAPRLVIEGLVMFGGVEIKPRKDRQRRLLGLAAGLRRLYGEDAASPRRG